MSNSKPVKLLVLLALAACGRGPGEDVAPSTLPVLIHQTPGTTALLQAVSAVSDSVVWISGHEGTWVRSTDGGLSWDVSTGPGADTLQFRDIHAFDAERAVMLSAGTGIASRIYWTDDAGANWTLGFLMEDERGFLDCMDFWDDLHGVAYGDSFDGVPYILRTVDGGHTWERPDAKELPGASQGEGGFASSGTCVRTSGERTGWIGTGAGGAARVLRTDDRGATWRAYQTPMVTGDVAGVFTVTFRNRDVGLVLGGDLDREAEPTENVFRTTDGGESWEPGGAMVLSGPVYGASFVPGTRMAVAVGPKGADFSPSDGARWISISTEDYWAVDFAEDGTGWMAGPEGRVTKVLLGR